MEAAKTLAISLDSYSKLKDWNNSQIELYQGVKDKESKELLPKHVVKGVLGDYCMIIVLLTVVSLGYLTLLEKKGVSLNPCDMVWQELAALVLILIPIYWVVISLYIYFAQEV